ncbi:ferredoxin FdxA [Ancylobacter polymorphus]|uniref:Ferredoxin n=1 Tax=Ancylobacter polymorphus TaxID=223390 RepID=A0A9E6ZZS3_9HYPH|nr:ferredoxin FdxA [Ancylobacter polymorphus]UOK73351.1 ferredoxin family protein [Ancylobacter polymorphus]
MPYVVTENCIACKYMDCVEVCPVECFYEGENMLVIDPYECIDCGVCEPECPAAAIVPDSQPGAETWLDLNRRYAKLWPNVREKRPPLEGADARNGAPRKMTLLSEKAGQGS